MNKSLKCKAAAGDESAIVRLVQKLSARTLNVQAIALSSLVGGMFESPLIVKKVMEHGAMEAVLLMFTKIDISPHSENEELIVSVLCALGFGFGNPALARNAVDTNTFLVKKAAELLDYPYHPITSKAISVLYGYSMIATRVELEEMVRMDIFREKIPNLLAHPCPFAIKYTFLLVQLFTGYEEGVEAALNSVRLRTAIKTVLEEEELDHPKLGTCLQVTFNMIQNGKPEHRAQLLAAGFVKVLTDMLNDVDNDDIEFKSSVQHLLQMLGTTEV